MPQFLFDSHCIGFRYWLSRMAHWNGSPVAGLSGTHRIYLGHQREAAGVHLLPLRRPVCLHNDSGSVLLNVTLVRRDNGKEVFFARELTSGNYLPLEFLVAGRFRLYHTPAFTQETLSLDLEVRDRPPLDPPTRFNPSLKPGWRP